MLSRVIVFNKRWGGQASRLHVSSYISWPDWHALGAEEFKASLTNVEIKLSDCLTLVKITGKHGRELPVLLMPEMKACIDTFNEYRGAVGIKPTTHLFLIMATETQFAVCEKLCEKWADKNTLSNHTQLQTLVWGNILLLFRSYSALLITNAIGSPAILGMTIMFIRSFTILANLLLS